MTHYNEYEPVKDNYQDKKTPRWGISKSFIGTSGAMTVRGSYQVFYKIVGVSRF